MLTFRAKEPGRCAQVPADRCSRRGNLRHRQSASYRRTRIRCQAPRQHSHHPVAFVSPPRISWGVSENR
ncbi:hypothetical protein GHK58_17310 [Sinorhizobium meliloti]|nr:hypothetical protein [Sinorhizobium meliloti]